MISELLVSTTPYHKVVHIKKCWPYIAVVKSCFKINIFSSQAHALFSLLPLRVKCQNHERVPISPILVVHVLASRCSRKPSEGPLPLRVKCQNHERVPISTISLILVANVYSSCQDMDHQIGTLSVFSLGEVPKP